MGHDPIQEDLVFLQRRGLPEPSFATVSDILADCSLDTPSDGLPSVEEAPTNSVFALRSWV